MFTWLWKKWEGRAESCCYFFPPKWRWKTSADVAVACECGVVSSQSAGLTRSSLSDLCRKRTDGKKKKTTPSFTKEDQSNWTTLIFFFPLPFYTCVYINISKKLFTLLFPLRLSWTSAALLTWLGRLKRWEATRWLTRWRREGGPAGCLQFLWARLTLGWLSARLTTRVTNDDGTVMLGGPSQPMNVYSSKCQ